MKSYGKLLSIGLILFVTAAFAAINLTGLWAGNYSWRIEAKLGPGLITKNGGNLLYLSKDGALYELLASGAYNSLGQISGVVNVVAPPTYIEIDSSKKYVIYVTAQGTAQNVLAVHKIDGSSSNPATTNLSGAAYGVVAYKDSSNNIVIFTATMDNKVCKTIYNTSTDNLQAVTTQNVGGPVKVPPILDSSKQNLYVLTQNGKFYRLDPSGFGAPELRLSLSGEFTVPMAMDESGYIYALNSLGVLYKIDPSGSENNTRPLASCDSAGVLVDGDGFIYVFGGGKVAALNSNLAKLGEYTIGQQITTTPAIVRGDDGKTYLIIPSSQSTSSGKITILSFNSTTGVFTKEWEFTVNSSFPISAAVGVAPKASLMGDQYYFATATNDGTVYAWLINARGPFGIWGMYGQNANRTGFVDVNSMLFKTRIYIKAYDGYYGKELSSTILGSTSRYGLLYDAEVRNNDNSLVAAYPNLRTNETVISRIPEGVPGAQKLVVKFATPTTSTLLFRPNFSTQGTGRPTIDSEFQFRFWDVGQNGYEGSEGDNPANITYRFSDRVLKVFTDATYTFYVYHKYPIQTNSESNTSIYGFFDYNTYRSNPTSAKQTINSSPTHDGKVWYAYKWNIYQWNPDQSTGYDRYTYYDLDKVTLPLKGPAYIEIYYAQLSATITLLLPEFAYGKVRAYLFLDAAPNSIAYNIKLSTKNNITISNVISEQFAPEVNKLSSSVSSNQLNYVLHNFEQPLTGTTRVATIALNLLFPNKVQMNGITNEFFEQFFDIYGYAQLQGQLVDPANLRAKKVYKTNKYLYVVGDFNDDMYVDINDWNLFVARYGTSVSGEELIFNIGPREDFVPPYPNYTNYKAGYLTDTTTNIDENDLYYFASMFGFAVPESERVK